MALLHMKKSDPLLELDLDFLRFPTHKNGWGVRYAGVTVYLVSLGSLSPGGEDTPGYLAPPPWVSSPPWAPSRTF